MIPHLAKARRVIEVQRKLSGLLEQLGTGGAEPTAMSRQHHRPDNR
jgi:hypothetical protein